MTAVTPPLVSIVTPWLGDVEALQRTAQGVFAGTLQDFEWVLSTPVQSSPPEPPEFVRGDSRVRVVARDAAVLEKSANPIATLRNAGVGESRARFIQHVDAGDVPSPIGIEMHLWWLGLHPAFSFVKGRSRVEQGATADLGWFHEHERFLTENVVPRGVMCTRDAHAQLGGFDPEVPHGLEFWDFFLRAAEAGKWGATLPDASDVRTSVQTSVIDPRAVRLFLQRAAGRSPGIFSGRWSLPAPRPHEPFEPLPDASALRARVESGRDERVLLIIPWMAMGGADLFNLNLIDQLRARGQQVSVACTLPHAHPWRSKFESRTGDLLVLPSFLRQSGQPEFLSALIQSRRPHTVLISNSEMGYASLALLRSRHPGIVFADYVHMEEDYWKHGGHARHSLMLRDQLDITMVASGHLKRWMAARGADPDRIAVVTINIDASRFDGGPLERARLRAALALPPEQAMILFPARLTRQKQPLVFAGVIRELIQRGEDVLAFVAGDGEEEPSLRRFIAENRLESRFRMLGPVDPDAMPDLIRAADIVLLPSIWEGIAVVLYEALAAGTAFVGADVGGQREIVPSGAAELLDPSINRDPAIAVKAYAEKVQSLLRDPARRAAMGEIGRAQMRTEYPISAMGDAVMRALARARQLHASAPRTPLPDALGVEFAVRSIEIARLEIENAQLWAHHHATRALHVEVAEHRHLQDTAASRAELELAELRSSRAFRLAQFMSRSPITRALQRSGLL